MSFSSSCSGPPSWEGTAAGTRLVQTAWRKNEPGQGRQTDEGQSAHAPARDAAPAPARPDGGLPTSTWRSRGPSSSPVPSPQRMRHGEAPLQADALVHQELPEEPGGAARGVPGGARPGGRGGRGGTLHRRGGVEAGRSAGRGTFSGQPRGRGRGEGTARAPPRPATGPFWAAPTGQMGTLRHGAGCHSLLHPPPLGGGPLRPRTRILFYFHQPTCLAIVQLSGITWLKRVRWRSQKGKHRP